MFVRERARCGRSSWQEAPQGPRTSAGGRKTQAANAHQQTNRAQTHTLAHAHCRPLGSSDSPRTQSDWRTRRHTSGPVAIATRDRPCHPVSARWVTGSERESERVRDRQAIKRAKDKGRGSLGLVAGGGGALNTLRKKAPDLKQKGEGEERRASKPDGSSSVMDLRRSAA